MLNPIKEYCITIKNFLLYLHEVRKSNPDSEKLDIYTFGSLEEADRRLNRTRNPDGSVILHPLGKYKQ